MVQAEKNNNSIFRIAFNLVAASFLSGIVIGAVYYVTAPIAAEKAEQMKQESMRELVADAEDFRPVPGREGWFEARPLPISSPVRQRGTEAPSRCWWQ